MTSRKDHVEDVRPKDPIHYEHTLILCKPITHALGDTTRKYSDMTETDDIYDKSPKCKLGPGIMRFRPNALFTFYGSPSQQVTQVG